MPRGGKRHRRLRRVVALILALIGLGALAGWLIYRASRPETYRPGEELPEITRKLATDLPPGAPELRFTDVTTAAGLGAFRTFAGARTSQLPEDMGSGLAWGDFDRDGDDDLFLVSVGGGLDLPPEELAPSELYENLGDGTFRKYPGFSDLPIHGMAAAWADYDGDGFPDLAVTGFGALLLFHNEEGAGGGRHFVAVPALEAPAEAASPGFWAGAVWGDFDNDRDPDLYICGYVRYRQAAGERGRTTEQYGAAVPYTLNPASYEPEVNLLFRNEGGGAFTEVALLYGVSNPEGRSLGALFRDFDDDGLLDLYVANDISDNVLYLNRGDTFEDVSLAAWVADYRGAMGLAAGDWNRDGDDDLFITHWVAQENALYDSRQADRLRLAAETGNPPPPLTFSDIAVPLGLGQIALPVVGWGTEFADFDADGWLDLAVNNGSTFEVDPGPGETGSPSLEPQRPFLFWNQEGKRFHDLAPLIEPLARPRVGRGLAVADYDGDGDLDLALVQLGEGVQLLRNDTPQGHWLKLHLADRRGGDGEGARIFARVGETVLRRGVTEASYLSQSSRIVHLGLGAATGVDEIEVRWLGGGTDTFTDLPADSVWELREGDPAPRRLAAAVAEGSPATPASAAGAEPMTERQRIAAFWEIQRAAMDALKRQGDVARATDLFRQALALDPEHEDARYYLANCLAAQGETEAALAELAHLAELNPASHRAHKQWGTLRAMTARSDADLAAAEEALDRALALNQEETGGLLVLGEITLLRGRPEEAERHFEHACHTNPKAVGGFFLRAYLAWKRGDGEGSRQLLKRARAALGEDWVPEGAVAEGDVEARMHREETPLSFYWRHWDGQDDPAHAFTELAARLTNNRVQ